MATDMAQSFDTPRGRVTVTRQAHNLKIAGSIPAPATSSDGVVKNVSFSLNIGDRRAVPNVPVVL